MIHIGLRGCDADLPGIRIGNVNYARGGKIE